MLAKIGKSSPRIAAELTSHDLFQLATGGGVEGISPDTAMRLSTVNTCVRILSESVAMLPCNVLRETAEGGFEKAKDHATFDVLRHKPNSWMNAFEYWEFKTRSMLLQGDAYSSKTQYRRELRELIPHHPKICSVKQLDNYELRYNLPKRQDVKQDQVFHLRDASADGVHGLSRIQQSSRAFNIAIKAEDWAHDVYSNNGIMPGYLATDGSLKELQKDELRKYWKGMDGRREVAEDELGVPVLSGGLNWKTIDINLEDAQLLEARKMQREDIFGIFRVPPGMGQIYEKATSQGTGVEQTQLQFVVLSLMPLLRRIEMSVETNVLTAKDRKEHKIRFNVNALLRGDMASRSEFYAKMLLNGAMSINEVRKLENLNPIPLGDVHRVPMNTQTLSISEASSEISKIDNMLSEMMKQSENMEKLDAKLSTVTA